MEGVRGCLRYHGIEVASLPYRTGKEGGGMVETVLSILIGLGLAAACGFRVFVPLLIMSLASRAGVGHLALSPSFAWIGSTPALLSFAVATVLEIAGYYIPWVDNLLDTVATPAAVVAGIVVTA